MASYYNMYEGNLHPGDIAKSSDIMAIQQEIKDAIKNVVKDLTEGQSWILGTNDLSDQNAFILTPDTKRAGRYIDQMNLAENDDVDIISIRETSYRQPIKLARSSVYSIIVKMQNKSEKSVPVNFELHDSEGNLIPNMKTILTLPKDTTSPVEYEIVFDLDYYPTAHGIESTDLEQDNPQLVNPNTEEESFETGVDYEDEETLTSSTAGASVIYLFIEALNRNKQEAFDVNTQQENGYKWNDEDPTFGIVINKNSTYGQLLEEDTGSGFTSSSVPGDLYFKEIYANAPTYKCEIGQAIIDGDKVMLADTHVSVGGASSEGHVVSYVYMDTEGHLNAVNSEPFTGSEPINPISVSEPHLHIANITTYMNDVKDPIIEQSDETQITRPRSHHERLRRLEKKTSYLEDISIPPRFKYTLTGEDWIDPNPNTDLTSKSYNGLQAKTLDSLDKKGYNVTTDANGNFVIKVSEAESFNIPITLKNLKSGKVSTESDKTKVITKTGSSINNYATDDIARAQTFAEIKNMKNNVTNGKLTLEDSDNGIIVATNSKQAKETEFNPWDDSKANRPASSNIKPTTRHYTITSGKNGANDWASEFPAMTFYTSNGYKLKKLQIPIYKFKNCSGIKFIIWKRQGPNNKKNTVWLEKKIYTSDVFSLKKAKVKKGYQYMENGFLINFGKKGLHLPAGQYVIVCLPIVKSGKGTVYVDTYKPKNSKDFCIRYYGAANASHFLLKDRYQEIWYNPAKAQVEETVYSKSGTLVSGVVSWSGREAIKSIKPTANLATPDGTKATLYVDVGGGWKKVDIGKENSVIGSGSGESFRWKIEFKGNAKKTPTLKYDKKKGYALNFEITRAEPETSSLSAYRTLNNNLCLTSKLFDANNILREYLGDMNWALQDWNKFSNYEFVRIWGTDSDDKKMLIDIAASDRLEEVKEIQNGNEVAVTDPNTGQPLYYPVYSFHYCDISLDDIPNTSVDYSNYDPTLEDDEHNLRMKLDTNNSYNDSDIHVVGYKNFELANEAYAVTTDDSESSDESNESEESKKLPDGLSIDLTKVTASDNNQVLAKAKFLNTLDLTQYTGIKLGLTISGTEGGTISGLALYISSQNEEDVPTNAISEDYLNAIVDGLPDLNSSTEDIIAKYANQVIVDTVDYNGTATKVYYQSVWNSAEQIWEWQQLHDVKSYNIYEITDRSTNSNTLKITKTNNGEIQYYEIEIDPDSVNLQYAKEMGIIILNDEEKYSNTNVNILTISDFKAIKNDYYAAFNASEKHAFQSNINASRGDIVTIKPSGSLAIRYSNSVTYTETVPPTSQIAIKHQNIYAEGEDLCTFDLTSKSTKGFNFVGIQLASDCLLTKNMLELHFRKINRNKDGQIISETTIDKIQLPTTNYIYYPTNSKNKINLVSIFKKLKTTDRFDKIVLHATNRFKNYAKLLKTSSTGTNLGDTISLYVGNISLYRANSLPLVYPYFRTKIYLDGADSISRDQIGIRKLGAIIQYQ